MRGTVLSPAFHRPDGATADRDVGRVDADADRLTDRLAGHRVEPRDGVVSSVRDPDGTEADRDTTRPTADLDWITEPGRCSGVDSHDGTVEVVGDLDRATADRELAGALPSLNRPTHGLP